MDGETNLTILLRNMQPELADSPFVFCSVNPADGERLLPLAVGIFRETEGISVLLEASQADRAKLSYTGIWAKITLTIHSDLTAVGFLAVITTKLAEAGISVNPISAFYHDHLFVPWERRAQAMSLLIDLSAGI
jgi:uncharacterized protein